MSELGAILETGTLAAVEIAASALAEQGHEPKPCPNCKNPLIGPYCAVCGQPLNTHRRTLKGLIHEFVKDIVSFDSRILRTGRALLFNPGELPRAFRDGRTQPYVPSVRLYLFVSLLFFLFLSATGLAFIQLQLHVNHVAYTHDSSGKVFRHTNGVVVPAPELKSDKQDNLRAATPNLPRQMIPKLKANGRDSDIAITTEMHFFQRIGSERANLPAELKLALDKSRKEMMADKDSQGWFMKGLNTTLARLETDPAALNGPLTAWIPRILFVLLPLFAALLALFYVGQRKKFLFVDHLVFSLTVHSFVFVLLILAAILAQEVVGEWVALIAWLAMSVYMYLSLKWFYGEGWWRTAWKFVGITFVYATFCLSPALIFALVMSMVAGG